MIYVAAETLGAGSSYKYPSFMLLSTPFLRYEFNKSSIVEVFMHKPINGHKARESRQLDYW